MKIILKNKSFFLLWLAQTLSSLGDNFGFLALFYAVYKLTGSKTAMASISIASQIPAIVVGLFAGIMVDRYSKKLLLIGADIIRGLAFLVVSYMAYLSLIKNLSPFLYLSFLLGLISPFFDNSQTASIPLMVKKEELAPANSFMQGSIAFTSVVGPAIAAIVIAKFGVALGLLVDAISFFISSFLIFLIRKIQDIRKKEEKHIIAEFKEGFSVFNKEKVLRDILFLTAIVNFAFAPFGVLIIPYIKEILKLDIAYVGYIQSIISLGFIAGSFITPIISKLQKRGLLISLTIAGVGSLIFLISLVHNIYFAFFAFFLMGVLVIEANILITVIYQEKTPHELLGRVISVRRVVSQGLTPLSQGVSGFFADLVGTSIVIGAGGVLATVIGFSSCFFKNLAGLNKKPQAEMGDVQLEVSKASEET